MLAGVATFCRISNAVPVAADEGFTGAHCPWVGAPYKIENRTFQLVLHRLHEIA